MTKNLSLGVLVSALALVAGGPVVGRLAIQQALASPGPSTPVVRHEQDSSPVSYSGAWHTSGSPVLSGGSAALSNDSGARVTFTFTGSAVHWIGVRDEWSGIAHVFLDGSLAATVDTHALPTQSQTEAVLYAVSGLPAGSHTLVIEVTGTRSLLSLGSWIWIDAFDVFPRFEQDNPSVSYSGTWHAGDSPSLSGGNAVLSTESGARAAFTFTGSAVRWFGTRDEWSGIAHVFLDGSLQAIVDTSTSPEETQAVLYAASGLPAESHTLVIEVTGEHGAASQQSWIWIDAFDLESDGAPPPPPPTVTRFEETDPAVTYGGTWFPSDRLDHSGGSARKSPEAGSGSSFTFTGTGVSWIGFRGAVTGIARVFLDGTLAAEVDTAAPSEEPQAVLFSATGLAPGVHTLVIEVTGAFNAPSSSAWIVVDAFEVVS
jgi:hypothetical protein